MPDGVALEPLPFELVPGDIDPELPEPLLLEFDLELPELRLENAPASIGARVGSRATSRTSPTFLPWLS